MKPNRFETALRDGGLALTVGIGAVYFRALFSAVNFKSPTALTTCDVVFVVSVLAAVGLAMAGTWRRH